ncbi:MAG: signal recognition particle-docking protein FtsY, partial [Rubellimicrobium sp.]|nr:signal recognition particle-docking protein FtsY [Rubellimicrobium sp.]
MSFFKKLKDQLFSSSSKLDAGLGAIVDEAPVAVDAATPEAAGKAEVSAPPAPGAPPAPAAPPPPRRAAPPRPGGRDRLRPPSGDRPG